MVDGEDEPVMRARASGGTLKVTILVFREPLGVDLAGVAMVDGDGVVKVEDSGCLFEIDGRSRALQVRWHR